MPKEETLKVKIVASIAGFTKGIEKCTNEIKGFKKTLATAAKGIAAFSGVAVGAVGATFALANSVATAGDNFQKMALRTGLSVSDLSRLDFAAKRSGTNIQVLESSIRYLTKAMADTKNGLGEAKKGFNELGISVIDSQGHLRNSFDVLKEVSNKLSKMKNETEKISVAQYIFGARFGTQLLPLLTSGTQGLTALLQKSDELGYTWSTRDANAAALFRDRLTDLESAFDGFKKSLMVNTFPFWEGALLGAQSFIQSLMAVEDTMGDVSEDSYAMGNSVLDVFHSLSDAVVKFQNGFVQVVNTLGIGLLKILGPVGEVAAGISGIFTGKGFKTEFNNTKSFLSLQEDILKRTMHISSDITSKRLDETTKIFNKSKKEFEDSQKALDSYKKALANVGVAAVNTGSKISNAANKAASASSKWRTFNIEGISSNRLLSYVGSLTSKTVLKHVVEIQLKWDGRKIKMDTSNPQLAQEIGRAVLRQIQNGRAVAFGAGG